MVLVGFDLLLDSSSPEVALVVLSAAFFCLREPFGPDFAESRWPARGVVGLEVSGVGIGVVSVEVVLLCNALFGAVVELGHVFFPIIELSGSTCPSRDPVMEEELRLRQHLSSTEE